MPDIALARVHCIVIDGDDARRFAQAEFSGDVAALSPGHWQWNAWLDARGRVEALMQLCDPGDGRLLAVLRGGDAARVRAGLARYLLRTRATLTVREFGGYIDGPAEMGTVQAIDAELVIGCGGRSLRLGEARDSINAASSYRWRLADIRDGWPTLPAAGPTFLPPALGLERLGAISFNKGCYPGQEIAARLHYRGGHKLRLHHVCGAAPLAPWRPAKSVDPTGPWILDSVSVVGVVDALMVAPRSVECKIIYMGIKYNVVSIFEP
ncbi:MAG: YgfZ/GcvT domain-containing protein [Rhodanobacteraceae bacterium]